MAKKTASRRPALDGQTEIDEHRLTADDFPEGVDGEEAIDELVAALEVKTDAEVKAIVAKRRKADEKFKEVVGHLGDLAKNVERPVRVGPYKFFLYRDSGGQEVRGYTTKGGVKGKKAKRDAQESVPGKAAS